MSNAVETVWVVGRYGGGRGKSVLAHAESGTGYVLLNSSGNKINPDVMVAFRYPANQAIPEHLIEVADPYKVKKYEKQRLERNGAHNVSPVEQEAA